jgi:hypothetical protein
VGRTVLGGGDLLHRGPAEVHWFFFAGRRAEGDAAVVRATERRIGALAMEAGLADPCVRLAALRERPLAVCVPWPPSADPLEQRIVGDDAARLAAAYFDNVAEVLRRGAALGTTWRERRRGRAFRWSDN